jgi:DNA-binding SARP family transcriptional activator
MDEVPRREAALGPEHPATIERVHRLGTLLHRAGRHEEALRHLRRVVQQRKMRLGPDDAKTRQAIQDAAACAEAQKERAKAKAAAEEVAAAAEEESAEEEAAAADATAAVTAPDEAMHDLHVEAQAVPTDPHPDEPDAATSAEANMGDASR